MEIPNGDLRRVDQADSGVREFEKYAAGGLEYLRTEFEQNPTQTPDLILEKMFRSELNQNTTETELPDL